MQFAVCSSQLAIGSWQVLTEKYDLRKCFDHLFSSMLQLSNMAELAAKKTVSSRQVDKKKRTKRQNVEKGGNNKLFLPDHFAGFIDINKLV